MIDVCIGVKSCSFACLHTLKAQCLPGTSLTPSLFSLLTPENFCPNSAGFSSVTEKSQTSVRNVAQFVRRCEKCRRSGMWNRGRTTWESSCDAAKTGGDLGVGN